MATINQRIPNFLGGVSQQPDKIKFPGQLRVCDNAVPDITFGLKKRPPAEFIGTLTGSTSGATATVLVEDVDGGSRLFVSHQNKFEEGELIRKLLISSGVNKDNIQVVDKEIGVFEVAEYR